MLYPVPRNAEVIRQWTLLRDLESARRLTIDEMAERTGVTTRTIRRDLDALQAAGFPLYDETHDGKKYWTLHQRAFRRLDDTGFTLAELSALYFSRTLLECLTSTPFHADVRSAFDKLAAALTPGMRQFLDRLPLAIQSKAEPGARMAPSVGKQSLDPKQDAARGTRIAQLLDAVLHHRRVEMTYHSFSSRRKKKYLIEPYRLVFAQGGLYLVAFVPEYDAFRTFAADRVLAVSLTEERFEPRELDEVFADSLGVHQGAPPERIEVVFDPQIAPYVRERMWHDSQELQDVADGGVRVVLRVSNDWALRSWILGFGQLAHVVSPPELAAQIRDEIDRARAQYGSSKAEG
jgi:predicted DNA-binding transcriptional regulator YafY